MSRIFFRRKTLRICVVWCLYSCVSIVAASSAIAGDGQADSSRDDQKVLAQAQKVMQDFRVRKASFAQFRSAMARLPGIADRALAAKLLVSGIDCEEPEALDEDRDGSFSSPFANFETRYPCVELVLGMGTDSVQSLVQELKTPRSATSKLLAQFALLRVLGVRQARDVLEEELENTTSVKEKRRVQAVLDTLR